MSNKVITSQYAIGENCTLEVCDDYFWTDGCPISDVQLYIDKHATIFIVVPPQQSSGFDIETEECFDLDVRGGCFRLIRAEQDNYTIDGEEFEMNVLWQTICCELPEHVMPIKIPRPQSKRIHRSITESFEPAW